MKLLLILAALLCVLALLFTIVPGFRFSILLCIAFALLCVLVYFLLKHPTPLTRRIIQLICIFLVIGGIAAGITLGSIVRAATPTELPACQYIIVLGAGVNGTVPSLTLRERINAAYHYLTQNPDTVAVLSGGQGRGESITEAACMYRELTKLGIPAQRLLLEEQSASTMENLTYSLEILEETAGTRPKKVGIVSSEYHLFRAKCFAGDLELEPTGIPAKTSWLALRVNYYLREIVAVWKYLILGP